MGLWGLLVCAWGTQKLAWTLDYSPALGPPLGAAGGRLWYWPWNILVWSAAFQGLEMVEKVANQVFLLGLAAPMLLMFGGKMLAQNKLKGRIDLHGSAHWASREDIMAMGYLGGQGVYVGGWFDERKGRHYYLRHDGPEHILCFAPTRSGKGVGLILPTLLAWEQSSVVLDIKGENFALTAGYLAQKGHKTLRFDPSDAEGASAAFNPLEEIRLCSSLAIPDAQQIASMVMDPNGKGLEDYWNKAAFGFFGGALLHCLIKTWVKHKRAASLHDVAVMLEDPERPIRAVFEEMLTADHAGMLAGIFPGPPAQRQAGAAAHVFIASAARGMLSKADNEMSGVLNTATANLALYKDPIVAQNISRCDFRLSDLMNHDSPVNLYLVISPADIDRLRPLLRIFLAQMLGRFTERMEFEDGAGKAAYRHRLLLMLDEFTSLGKLAIVERAIAYMAGYGVKGYFIVQDTKQLTQAYGQDNAIMANCHLRIAYAPNLPETAEYLSKMAGTTTVVDEKISISGGGGKGGRSRSRSVSETSRPLLTPDECLRLPGLSRTADGRTIPGDMLIFTAGHPPIYGRQLLYFQDPVFSRRGKVKAPGVEEGWRRGLSHSLYFPMPLAGGEAVPGGAVPASAAGPKVPAGPAEDLEAAYRRAFEEAI